MKKIEQAQYKVRSFCLKRKLLLPEHKLTSGCLIAYGLKTTGKALNLKCITRSAGFPYMDLYPHSIHVLLYHANTGTGQE